MTAERRVLWWAAALALLFGALYAVSAVLLPFVVGFALAYLLDPVADRMETAGMRRWLAAAIITSTTVIMAIVIVLLLVPLLQVQVTDFIGRVPRYLDLLREQAMSLMELLRAKLSDEDMKAVRDRIGSIASPDALSWVGKALGQIWGGGVALFNLLSLLFITPIVAFYMLRDWDRIVAAVDGWLPRDHLETIRGIARDIDRVLSGFVRGQLLVCLGLGAFYGIGLSIVGLDFGLFIGIVTGLLSFVPIFGMLIGFVVGIGVALVQFGLAWPVVAVAVVFAIGQFVEGNFVTPKIVGERVGLHPVWTIFALLAGGAIAGFTGLLLAVPAAAVIGVLSRFAVNRWTGSAAYRGAPAGDGTT